LLLRTNIFRRGGIFYHRQVVPQDLRGMMNRRELKLSLRTSCPDTARRLGAEVQLRAEQLFLYLRRTPSLFPEQIQTAIRTFYHLELEADLHERQLPHPKSHDDSDADWDALNALENETVDALRRRNFVEARHYIEHSILASLEESEPTAPGHGVLCHSTLRAVLEVLRRMKEREIGNWAGEPTDPLLRTPSIPTNNTHVPTAPMTIEASPPAEVTMEELIDAYMAERLKVDGGGTSESSRAKYENDIRASLDWFGEYFNGFKAPKAYKKSEFVDYKNALLTVPTNFRKIFPGASILTAIERNKTAEKPTLSTKTINKKLIHLKSFFEWLHRNDHIAENPAKAVKLYESKRSSYRSKRHPFTTSDLAAIFNAKQFNEPWATQSRKAAVTSKVAHTFWLPLLALYTGARAGEIAQLHCADIIEKDGVQLIYITEKLNGKTAGTDCGKSLKNADSERYIPVHPELLALGFIQFVDRMKASKSTRLFPACARGADGQFSPYSKSFTHFLRKLGVKENKSKTFHSFRHSFEDAMREAGLAEAVACRLTGRTDRHSSAGYGVGHSPKRLYEEISKIRYDGLDLSHLHGPKKTCSSQREYSVQFAAA
jgi:integrase|tara:strand:- start:38104 stop:39906 length:1803 start_codon:yes stop_codon:yes gene_type:complete